MSVLSTPFVISKAKAAELARTRAYAIAIPAPGSTDFDMKRYCGALLNFRTEVCNVCLLGNCLVGSLDEVTQMHLNSEASNDLSLPSCSPTTVSGSSHGWARNGNYGLPTAIGRCKVPTCSDCLYGGTKRKSHNTTTGDTPGFPATSLQPTKWSLLLAV